MKIETPKRPAAGSLAPDTVVRLSPRQMPPTL